MTDEKDEIRATQRLWDDKVMLIMLALCFVLLLAIIVVQFLETPAFQKRFTPRRKALNSRRTTLPRRIFP